MKQVLFSEKYFFSSFHFTNGHYTDMRCGAPVNYLAYMIEGHTKIVCDRMTLHVNEGDVFYIPKNLSYQSYWYGKDIRFLSFGFSELSTAEYANFDLQTVNCPKETVEKIRAIPCLGSRITCEALGYFYKAMAEVIPLMTYTPESRAQQLSYEIKRQIRLNPHASLAQIAKNCNISEALLYESFKKATNKTPNQYRQTVLCDMAVELLLNTNLSVEEISEKLHFSSSSYFRKILKNHTKKAPREIRKTTVI